MLEFSTGIAYLTDFDNPFGFSDGENRETGMQIYEST